MSLVVQSSPTASPSIPSASTANTRVSEPKDSSTLVPATTDAPPVPVSPTSAPADTPSCALPTALPPPTTSSPPSTVSLPPASAAVPGNAQEAEKDANAEEVDVVDDGGPRGRGKPSNFTGARLLAMQKGLKTYMALKTRKEKKGFWPTFMSEFMEEFPLSKYPIPKSRLTARESFEEKTEAEFEAMTPADKADYLKSKAAANVTDEELYLQMVKDWVFWQQTNARKAEGGITGAMFRAELEKKQKKPKPQFNQWVMKHKGYKGQVVARSSETGRLNRLQSRATAVKDILKELPEDEEVALRAEYDAMVKALDADDDDEDLALDIAEQRSRRKNFGPLAQEVLNIWRKLTGLNLTLLAGECLDGDADYDSCVVFSKPDGCVDMDDCEGVDFDRFSNTFLMWLKEIHSRTNPGSNSKAEAGSTVSSSTPTPSRPKSRSPADLASIPTLDIPTTTAVQGKSGKRKGKKSAKRDGDMSEVETTEPSEPSDMGSEDEDERVDVGKEVTVVRTPVDSTGLWEKNDEGLPVLKVAMSRLTRDQQAAFRHECAAALGLTKAVEELNEDIQRSRKAKNPGGSRHKGSKPTRRSGRIQATEDRHAEETKVVQGQVDEEVVDAPMSGLLEEDLGDSETSGKEVVVEVSEDTNPSSRALRSIPSIDNVELLPAWAKAVVNGHAHLDMPHMEDWAQFNVNGCSTQFLREYGAWLLGPKTKNRPEAWSVVVYKWIELEELWNQAEIEAAGAQVKMLKNKRPKGYLQWFKYGRLRWEELVPSETNPETLAKEWWVWWSRVVNPRWRPKAEEMVMPGGNGSWEAVRIPGKDGFVLLLVSLRWWCDLLDHPGADCLWLATLKSVYWTLEELQKDAKSFTEEGESAADDEHEDALEGRKRAKTQRGGRDRKRRRR